MSSETEDLRSEEIDEIEVNSPNGELLSTLKPLDLVLEEDWDSDSGVRVLVRVMIALRLVD